MSGVNNKRPASASKHGKMAMKNSGGDMLFQRKLIANELDDDGELTVIAEEENTVTLRRTTSGTLPPPKRSTDSRNSANSPVKRTTLIQNPKRKNSRSPERSSVRRPVSALSGRSRSPTNFPRPVKEHASHELPLGPVTPGPGNYSPYYDAIYNRSPTPSRSTSRRFYRPPNTNEITPGPGVYSPKKKDEIQNPIGWRGSFGKESRFKYEDSRSKSPGPAYHPVHDSVETSPRSYTIPKSPRSQSTKFTTPGPGSYNGKHGTSRTPTPTFGQEKKLRYTVNSTPGPGNYTAEPVRVKSPSFSFSKARREEIPRSTSPGPSAYEPKYDVKFKKEAVAAFSKERRELDIRSDTPSSFEYSPEVEAVRPKSPRYSFGKSKREIEHRSTSPGPGAYNYKSEYSHPKYTFGKEKRSSPRDRNSVSPGPSYNIIEAYKKLKDNTTGKSFSKAKKESGSRSNTPGPGDYQYSAYEISANKSRGHSIGKEKRFKPKVSSIPAPSAYNPHISAFDGVAASFSKQKRDRSPLKSTPGPGAYNVSTAYVHSKSPSAVLYLTG